MIIGTLAVLTLSIQYWEEVCQQPRPLDTDTWNV